MPISPLSSARNKLNDALNEMKPKKNGDTGLFDTALAAYKNVQNGWQAGRVNSVILFTDGVTESHDSMGTEFGEERLVAAAAPLRPYAAEAIVERLFADATHFNGGVFHDDATIVCVAL